MCETNICRKGENEGDSGGRGNLPRSCCRMRGRYVPPNVPPGMTYENPNLNMKETAQNQPENYYH